MRGLKFKFKYKVTGGSRGGAREARAPLLFWVEKKKEEDRKKDEKPAGQGTKNHASP